MAIQNIHGSEERSDYFIGEIRGGGKHTEQDMQSAA
jgi:hypothetical protein